MLLFDNLPIELAPDLQKKFPEIDFIIADPNENLKPQNKEIIIIDTILGIKDVLVIHDINQIQNSSRYSLHDLDLGFNLKLLQKIGTLSKVTIFGLPKGIKKDQALKKLEKLISRLIK